MHIKVINNSLGGVQIVVNNQYVIEDYDLTGDFIAEAIIEKAQREGWEVRELELRSNDADMALCHPRCAPATKKNIKPRKFVCEDNRLFWTGR